MLTGTFTVETTASAEDAHSYLADLCHQVDWRDDVIATEVETGQAGEDGTIYRQHVHQGPGTSWRRIEAHVSGLDVGFETLGGAPVPQAAGTSLIEPSTDGGSVVRSTIRIALAGPGKLLQPIVRRELDRRLDTYPIDLKRRLDQLHR